MECVTQVRILDKKLTGFVQNISSAMDCCLASSMATNNAEASSEGLDGDFLIKAARDWDRLGGRVIAALLKE